jgi:5-methylcytosine-specific restriction enzyme subunit McrC
VLQGYRTEEDALQTVRGRIRFDEQLRRRQGRFPPLELRFDEFTTDIEENRLLKAAIHRLRRLRLRSPVSRHALEAFEDALSEVQLVGYDARRLPELHWTRLNERYRPAVELARLILRAVSFELGHGATPASAFLLNMNEVFENFVVVALRDALRLSERAFPQGNAGRWLALDQAGRVRLKPDLSWWEDGRCRFVGDVKYKRIRADGVLHPDLYQLLAYIIASNLPGGLLIYAAGEDEPAHHAIVNVSKHLDVVTLDLSGAPDNILAQIAAVAECVRQLRAEGAYGRARRAALGAGVATTARQ